MKKKIMGMTAGCAVLAVLLQLDGTFSYYNKNKWWRRRRFSGQRCFRATPSWLWQDLVKPRDTAVGVRRQALTCVNREPRAVVTWLGVLMNEFSIPQCLTWHAKLLLVKCPCDTGWFCPSLLSFRRFLWTTSLKRPWNSSFKSTPVDKLSQVKGCKVVANVFSCFIQTVKPACSSIW